MKRRHKKRKTFKNPYKTENELCNVFIKHARSGGWKIYPETAGFDIILVKNSIQIGIQAKLKNNIDVLFQAIEYRKKYMNTGPNIRAVLVPRASLEFIIVAMELNIFVIEALNQQYSRYPYYRRKTKLEKKININLEEIPSRYYRQPKHLCWIPEVEIDIPAGVKSPKSITEWKIKAVKLCILLEQKGYLTNNDFIAAQISNTTWKIKKWLIPTKEKEGRLVKYIKNIDAILPDAMYPEITTALKKNNH